MPRFKILNSIPENYLNNQSVEDLQQTDISSQSIDQNTNEAKRVGAGILASAARGVTSIPELVGSVLGKGVTSLASGLIGDNNLEGSKLGQKNIPGNPERYGARPQNDVYTSPEFKKTLGELNQKDPKQLIGEQLGYENLEPQSFGESLLHGVAEDLPNILMSPTGIISKIGSSVLSNIGSKGAKNLGFGNIAQIASGLGTQGLGRYLSKRGAGGLVGDAKKIMNSLYEKWDKYAANAKVESAPYLDILESAKQTFNELPVKVRENASVHVDDFIDQIKGKKATDYNNAKDLMNLISGKTAKVSDTNYKTIVDIRRLIGQSIPEAKNNAEKGMYKNLYKQFSQQLDSVSKSNPEVAGFLKAQNIDLGINGSGFLRKLASRDKSISELIKDPLVKSMFGLGSIGGLFGLLSPKKLAVGAATSIATPKIARAINFMKNPETLKLFNDASIDAVIGDKVSLINNLKSLNVMSKKSQRNGSNKESFRIL